MAIKATVETLFGSTQEVYIRLNNVEASNHRVKTVALFRGFVSKEAFDAGKHFVWEQTVEFDADVSNPLWGQAYEALKAMPEMAGAVDC